MGCPRPAISPEPRGHFGPTDWVPRCDPWKINELLQRSSGPTGRKVPGGPGWSPTRGSHRSVRARLAHTARLTGGWRPAAIRCCRVDRFSRFGAPGLFPFNGSTMRYLLSSPGSLRDWFPWFPGSMKYSDSLPPLAPRFVSFAWRYHSVRLCSLLPFGPTPAGGLEFSGLATPSQFLSKWRRQGLSGSWETRTCLCPGLRPRQDLPTRPLRWFGAAPT
jgi:hypothetical protein